MVRETGSRLIKPHLLIAFKTACKALLSSSLFKTANDTRGPTAKGQQFTVLGGIGASALRSLIGATLTDALSLRRVVEQCERVYAGVEAGGLRFVVLATPVPQGR